jgi:hypothetical protein
MSVPTLQRQRYLLLVRDLVSWMLSSVLAKWTKLLLSPVLGLAGSLLLKKSGEEKKFFGVAPANAARKKQLDRVI